jgi:hypothetical protein
MTRKLFLIPALLIGATLCVTESASAHPPLPPLPGPHFRPLPGPHFRPLPPPIVVRPSISIGLPILPPPPPVVVRPTVVVDPYPVVPVYPAYYRVAYRATCNDPWITYQSFRTPDVARDVAADLRDRGYESTVFRD